MKRFFVSITVFVSVAGVLTASQAVAAGKFVRLSPLPAPKIVALAEEFPGGAFQATHLLDGLPQSEFASNGKGTATFVEFDFGAAVTLGAFRHVDRNDLANVAESRLTFLDRSGAVVDTTTVPHAGRRAGLTIFALPHPVTAWRVRWQVTRLANEGATCAGGAEIVFFKTGVADETPCGMGIVARSEPVILKQGGRLAQPFTVDIDYPYGMPSDVLLRVDGQEPKPAHLVFGAHRFTFNSPVIEAQKTLRVSVDLGGKTVAERVAMLKPCRKTTVFLLPHSHVDIGYTHRQADVLKRQWQNIETALELVHKTAGYPEGARFKWNTEVLWPVDAYLQQSPREKQERLVAAIRSGQVGLDALYGNELTGLCRPEELLRLMQWGATLGRRCGVKVESAMISDVPGLTWGTVSACAQAGVRYFSLGINYNDGGRTLPAWEDKPFYWLGPDGHEKVLCLLPYKGYALGHTGYKLNEQLPDRLKQLEDKGYPYDVVQLRWNVGGDNGPPDQTLPDLVRRWNDEHAFPRLVIATTAEAFRALETRHAAAIPAVRGDFTPYWENGACSTALETALNRTAAERLVQAETLAAMLGAGRLPAACFTDAWRNVVLYDEHTWGAYNSVSEPDLPFVKDQWKVKQAFAVDADTQSRSLVSAALAFRGDVAASAAVDVFNTASWPRSGLVVIDKTMSAAGDLVVGPHGETARSQRLSTGELAFLAVDVPPLAGQRYSINAGKAPAKGSATARGTMLTAPDVSVTIDPRTGAIASLYSSALAAELSDTRSGVGLDHYAYVKGDRVTEPMPAGPATVRVKEAGPLVASLLVESAAPGCRKFSREIQVVDGLDQVDIVNVVDKLPIREKEAVHLGFAFNIAGGVMRLDVPWAIMRPEADQIAGSCKNWFSVGRWVDVSNAQHGVTWATLDAPIVEVGAITDDKIGSVPDPDAWLAHVQPSQTFYSMIMNNHWHTNYKADQEGPTTFRYSLLPHGSYDAAAAERFGIGCSQPLLAVPARGPVPAATPLVQVQPASVLVASLKPSEDRKALVIRLFNPGEHRARATLHWGTIAPRELWISNLAEDRLEPVPGAVDLGAGSVVSLRAELAR